MTNENFADFDDYEPMTENIEPYEAYLSVRGLLCVRFGKEHGDEIYSLLYKAAENSAAEIDAPIVPGIIFNAEGGEFVGFENNLNENEENVEEYFD